MDKGGATMTHRADPAFLLELKKYGDVNIEACFNCGNCSSVCPLSTDEENFPRRMIRYAQLGMQDELQSSRELWMCYYCGECTATCPRQADPGEFMAAARRYAMAKYDRLGLAKMLYTSRVFNVLFLILMAIVLSMFMYASHGPLAGDTLRLFEFIPAGLIHDLGLGVIILVGLAGLWGAITMITQVGRTNHIPTGRHLNWLGALWETIGLEVVSQKRYRQDCEAYSGNQPWYRQKWFFHAATMWGFLGLLAATVLDYLLELAGVKQIGTWVPLWDPIRLLGTCAGLFLVYGTTGIILRRLRKTDEATTHSTLADWDFLVYLWLSGVSGFFLEISLYLPPTPMWAYWMFLFHVTVAMELVLLAPFTKFAHAFYRTVALYMHALKPMQETQSANAEAAD
jgi:ferredoxin/nitrate reductase gamma subunit